MCKRRIWKWVSLSIGAPLGNLEGRFIYWGLWETVKQGSGNGVSLSLSMGALWWEPKGRALLVGALKDIQRKALEIGNSLHSAPVGNLEARFIYHGLQES
jgi:hypothetical protein